MTGAEAVIESLKREGVDVIFGYPGGAVLPIYDVLYRAEIRHILTRHEQGAAHAADGYARVTGKVGVCIATSGPGATNLVTGLANAYMDSIPVVALTGQVNTTLVGRDSFQEADITGITMPITKHNYLVKQASDIPRVMKEAFHIARTGRPGPVLVDLPKDITTHELDFAYPETVDLPGYKPTYEGNYRQQLAVSYRELTSKSTPGRRHQLGPLMSIDLAEKCRIPVTTTLMGMGCFRTHPLYLGCWDARHGLRQLRGYPLHH